MPGYPDRILPKDADAAKKLKERTLTNLYNQRPQWLADAHEALDRAVAAAYGWPEDVATEEALEKLLALNLARAAKADKDQDAPNPLTLRSRRRRRLEGRGVARRPSLRDACYASSSG